MTYSEVVVCVYIIKMKYIHEICLFTADNHRKTTHIYLKDTHDICSAEGCCHFNSKISDKKLDPNSLGILVKIWHQWTIHSCIAVMPEFH